MHESPLQYQLNKILNEQTNETKLNEEFVYHFEGQSERNNIDTEFFNCFIMSTDYRKSRQNGRKWYCSGKS